MAATENYDEVFKKFPYKCVMDGDCQIRRYRGELYTKWKNWKFDSFVYAIDGEALFKAKRTTMTEGGREEGEVIPSFLYAVGMREARVTWFGDSESWGVEDDPKGNDIFCELDYYRDKRRYRLQAFNGQLIRYLEQGQLGDYLETYLYRIMRDDVIREDENEIYYTYLPHKMKLNDVEYTYLQAQLQHIQHIRDENLQCKLTDAELSTLHGKLSARSLVLVPKAKEEEKEDKGASRWDRFRRWTQGQRMQAMLDELRRLGGEEAIYSAREHVFCGMPKFLGAKKQYDLGEYDGELRADKRHGKGEFVYKSFDYFFPQRYDGAWVDDKIQGNGVMEYNDKSVYSGSWKNGVMDGEGEMQYNNGDTYTGCWANGMRVGQGLMVFTNKNKYEGGWKSDKMSDGTYTNESESWCFAGTFDGEYPKAGTLTYSDNGQTLTIRSESWQRVSIHAQKPVCVDIKPSEMKKTSPPPQAKSKMSEFFKKIHDSAVNIYDDVDLYLERRRDQANEPGFPAHTRYRH